MTTEELRIVISAAGSASYGTQMRQATQSTNNFKASIAATMSTLAKLLSAGLIAKFAKECVNAASDLQEVANVTNVTFGAMAETVNQWAKTQAASFGLSETAAKRYVGSFGTMAKQFGMTTEQAANMGIALTKLTGDVASFYNLDNATAYTKLKSVFTGETESLKELGVVMTEAQLNAYALEKGINKQVKSMTEGEKVLLRYSFVTDKLSHAQGDFARTSDGWANSVRTFQLQLENLKIQIGNELLPVAGYGLSLINKGLQFISPMLIGVAKTVKAYTEAWKNADSVTKAFVKTSIGIVAVMVITPKIIGIVSAAVKLLTINVTTLSGALTALGGIISILLVGMALIGLKKQIERTSDTVQDFENITADTTGYVDSLAESVDGLGESTKGLDLFLASFDEVNKVGGGGSLMSGLVNADDIANILAATTGINDMNSLLDELNFKSSGIEAAFNFDKVKENVKGFFSYLVESIKNGEYKTNLSETISLFDEWIQNTFPEFHQFATNIGSTAYDVVEKIKEVISNAKQAVIDFINETIKETKEFLGFTEEITWTGGDIGERLNGFKPFSRHAVGGVPSKGSLFIAGEAGAELVGNFGGSQTRVLNSSQMGELGTSQPIIQFSPHISIDGRRITAAVVEGINNITRSSGNSPLIELG